MDLPQPMMLIDVAPPPACRQLEFNAWNCTLNLKSDLKQKSNLNLLSIVMGTHKKNGANAHAQPPPSESTDVGTGASGPAGVRP
jgi:hypothetical protein